MMNGILIASYDYDAKTRRVRKTILKTTTPYFYDGWSLVEERIANAGGTCSTNRHYWGKDLSGTLQGAGGGGGLLCLTLDGATYIPYYDNNGRLAVVGMDCRRIVATAA